MVDQKAEESENPKENDLNTPESDEEEYTDDYASDTLHSNISDDKDMTPTKINLVENSYKEII